MTEQKKEIGENRSRCGDGYTIAFGNLECCWLRHGPRGASNTKDGDLWGSRQQQVVGKAAAEEEVVL